MLINCWAKHWDPSTSIKLKDLKTLEQNNADDFAILVLASVGESLIKWLVIGDWDISILHSCLFKELIPHFGPQLIIVEQYLHFANSLFWLSHLIWINFLHPMFSELTVSYLILSLFLIIKLLIKSLFFTSSLINFNFLETFEFSEIIHFKFF
jgi:hypothetical protein